MILLFCQRLSPPMSVGGPWCDEGLLPQCRRDSAAARKQLRAAGDVRILERRAPDKDCLSEGSEV